MRRHLKVRRGRQVMAKNKSKSDQSDQLVNVKDNNLEQVSRLIDAIENDLFTLRKILLNSSFEKTAKASLSHNKNDGHIVEGIFNGEEMIDGQGKHYHVSPNYASKSKLVTGDQLKLTIASDGSFIFKQIGPIERQNVVGIIHEKNGKYQVDIGGKLYNVLQASVTYFKAKPGNKVTIVIPKNLESNWAALENIITK